MAKAKKDRARVRSRRRQRKKLKNPASSARAEQTGKLLESLREQKLAAFAPIAKLIAPDPPEWLAEHLQRWSPTIFLSRAVEMRQSTRAEMRQMLAQISSAAGLLQRALSEGSVREFLDADPSTPMDSSGKFQMILGELLFRADRAARSPILDSRTGRTKAGRGPALPDGAISAQTYCALLIAETWKWFRGEYPAPRNRQAARAVDLYWQLSGGQKQIWGNDPLSSWRHHFIKAQAIPAEKDRAEYRRHLLEANRAAALFEPATAELKGAEINMAK